jgi:hypothetical protein
MARRTKRGWLVGVGGTAALTCASVAVIPGVLSGANPPTPTLTLGTSWFAGQPQQLNETVPATTCAATFTLDGARGGPGYTGGGQDGAATPSWSTGPS